MIKTNQKNWSCPRKQYARLATILDPYHDFFGQAALPPEQQYWTMSGQCGDKEGNAVLGCEVSQIIDEGFVTPTQIRAVEINPEIHALNQQAYPNINFINNDFYEAMEEAYAADEFNPGFINLDTIQTPPMAVDHLERILRLITDMKHTGPLMIVTNMIISGRHLETYTSEEAVACVLENEKIQRLLTLDWKHTAPFEYNGTGRSRTRMCSFIMAKEL